MPTTGLNCSWGGTKGAGGALARAATRDSSCGALRVIALKWASTCGACPAGHMQKPAIMGATGCRRKLKRVTMPKLPPPPRSAQNRSAFSVSLAGWFMPVK